MTSPGYRAELAAQRVEQRFVRRLWGLPGTALGVKRSPPEAGDRRFVHWDYWWQAHLLDAELDAALRRGLGTALVRRLARGIRLRNARGWTNTYYDDMAWLALALERGTRLGLVEQPRALAVLERTLLAAWHPGGDPARDPAVPWHVGSDYFNVPANAPVALFLLRRGHVEHAVALANWMHAVLLDDATGLYVDGIRRDGRVERNFYSYCQGVPLQLEAELSVALPGSAGREHRARAVALIAAIEAHCTEGGALHGDRTGDAGLFDAICCRYLVDAPPLLDDERSAQRAAGIVRATAQQIPAGAGPRELAASVGEWMILEAAARLTR